MASLCIHGFRGAECAACRTCPHGVAASHCARCLSAAASSRPPRTRAETFPSQEYAGYEIFYVPAVSGWHFRAHDSISSPLSYRSVFLARKAIDNLATASEADVRPR